MVHRLFLICAAAALGLHAESGTTSIRFAGVPVDGGQTCASCHTGTLNPAGGSVQINATDYNPGVMQTLHITITDPSADRWGFQLTARAVSDETTEAGTFTADALTQVRCDDGTRYGSAGPCAGTREFAEHVLAPTTSAGSGYTFNVNWSPPANEVGDVRLYLSAVAANGDMTAAGDHVYTAVRVLSATGACTLTAKPTLRTAVNGASFLPQFSSNAMLSIFGLGFQVPGRTRLAGAGDILNSVFPTQLACVAVEINGTRVPIAYIQQDQINVQAPALAGTAPVSLVVVLNPGRPNELRSDIATLTAVQAFAPAFFSFSGTSSVAAQFANSATIVADPTVVPGGQFAKPGDIVTLYGTGFGDTNPSVPTGQLASGVAPLRNTVTVSIGGIPLAPADILYAGLSPGSISGLYQLNVRIPAGAPNGNLSVVASIGGFDSQTGETIPVQKPAN